MGSGEGYSALRSQAPKYLRTWDGLSKPIPVRIEGNLDTTTPMRTKLSNEKQLTTAKSKARDKVAKKGEKGKFICWNKGNASFMTKKPDIEKLIEDHKPLMVGILEANMKHNICQDILAVDGYKLERDNLHLVKGRTRTAVYINQHLRYRRREDLEPDNSPTIWLEVNPQSAKPYLVFFGYREWRSLVAMDKNKSKQMKEQLIR